MPYTPILATLGYVMSSDGKRVLLVHRNARPADIHFGKYNGLGGKLERDEDIVAGMRRELKEEAGIEVVSLHLQGTISFPGFGKAGEDWFVFVFVITDFTGTPPAANVEGDLEWVRIDQLEHVPLWDGDRKFLPLVFGGADSRFHGLMPYESGVPTGWSYTLLKSE